MAQIAVLPATRPLHPGWRPAVSSGRPLTINAWRVLRRCLQAGTAAIGLLLLMACSPEYDWRDVHAPGGEYQVQLPARPVSMTRRIHLESDEVEMSMQGARVNDNAFTVAEVPVSGLPPQHILQLMREQMLRNIGAPDSLPPQEIVIDLVDAAGMKVGTAPAQAVSARGTGKHADMELRARFVLWRGHALQAVAIGPTLDSEQAGHFLESFRLVRR